MKSFSFIGKKGYSTIVAEIESAVEVGLVRAGRLRQAVLRSVFEGRL
jgi:hypothetical protein